MRAENKKKRMFLIIACVLGALLLFAAIARMAYLSYLYPSPDVMTLSGDDVLRVGNYEITLTDWKWSDGEIVHQIDSDFRLLVTDDGEEYPADKERVGLIEITVKKTADDNTVLDFTEVHFESGTWGNQFDLDLFKDLNPDLGTLTPKMGAGETIKVIFPMTMNDMQFPEKSWEKIDDREFYIIFQYYPVKYQFLCNPV